ncbi:ORF1 [Pitorquevirus ursid11]|uniref:Capsid protein n=1 Tax=Giant panda anellovirus TaxID=2016460 RepID=A0A220IGK3_9VIRU|nr:ORF1 [Giant panda anellovirus]ASH99106.1 ORF1 [Giant panda anellovirus]
MLHITYAFLQLWGLDASPSTVSSATTMPWHRRHRRRSRRHFFRYRRWRKPRRFWRRAWRRRYPRRRVRPVYQTQPRKRQHLVVTGWEILGVIGSQIIYDTAHSGDPIIHIKDVAPTNKQVQYFTSMIPTGLNNTCDDRWPRTASSTQYWDFVGGWGYAHFTLAGLVLRNLLGMNRFSTNIRGWTHIKFKGFKWQLVRGRTVDYLFRPEMHRGPLDDETYLLHPAHLLNMPFVKWVESVKRSHCCRSPIIRRRPPIDLLGWHDMEDFKSLLLGAYQWSAFDPDNPLGKNPIAQETADKQKKYWWKNEWMREKQPDTKIGLNKKINWSDRVAYDNNFIKEINNRIKQEQSFANQPWSFWDWLAQITTTQGDTTGKHSPFLPPIIPSEHVNTLWFRYKFYFQLGGATIGRDLQDWPIKETDDNTRPCNTENGPCSACIRNGDLDSTGFLTEKALARITERDQCQQQELVEEQPKSILKRRKRKRVTWYDNPTHTNPEKKNKYL